MNKTLKTILLRTTLVGAFFGTTHLAGTYIGQLMKEEPNVSQQAQRPLIPQAGAHQTVIVHPEYLAGKESLGYTMLSDIDMDGKWDMEEKVCLGFTKKSSQHALTYKNGFGPSQTVPEGIQFKFVDSTYFDKYK